MAIQDLFTRIEAVKAELEHLPPIQAKDEQRLWEKFRLEWNYNSNHIEGNTLTYGETMLLLIKGKTTGDHDKREYDEMEAHDVAVSMVREWASEDRPLTATDICQLNKIILVRPFWKEAITASGAPTQKRVIPGEYKNTPNHVLLPNGEIFRYSEPEEVPIQMQELLDWYRQKTAELPSVEMAALLHYRLVRIHPFDEGNGRVSRLVMNYHLLKGGFPPVIIPSADKKNYLTALSKADAGDVDAFVEYIGNQLLASLALTIKATKGESVEEADDFDKKLELWQRKFTKQEESVLPRSNDLVYERYQDSIKPFFELFLEKTGKIEPLFNQKIVKGWVNKSNADNKGIEYIEEEFQRWRKTEAIIMDSGIGDLPTDDLFQSFTLAIEFKAFKRSGTNVFDLYKQIGVEFQDYKYTIKWRDQVLYEGLYTQIISPELLKKMVQGMISDLMEEIDEKVRQ